MEYIIIIGIFQALAAAGLLWRSRLRNSADGLLILFMCCIALHLSIKFVIFNLVSDEQVHLTMNTFINFCYAPLLYLYTRKVTDPGFICSSKWFLFLPFLVALAGYFSVAGLMASGFDPEYRLLNFYNQATFWSLMPFDLLFFSRTYQWARRRLSPASQERQLIVQLSYLFFFMIAVALGFYALRLFGVSYNLLVRSISYATLILISLRIIRFRYVAFQGDASSVLAVSLQPAAPAAPADELPVVAVEEGSPETKRTRLNMEEMQLLWGKLEAAMQQQGAFRDSELSLDRLSMLVGSSKYHISETLNVHAGVTFYQYINQYRVKHVLAQLRRLKQQELQVNLLSIAFDAGFNSKSSFNRYFKVITGFTPTAYYEQSGLLT